MSIMWRVSKFRQRSLRNGRVYQNQDKKLLSFLQLPYVNHSFLRDFPQHWSLMAEMVTILLKLLAQPWPVWLGWLEHHPVMEGLLIWFSIRATHLGFGFNPQLGYVWEGNWLMFFSVFQKLWKKKKVHWWRLKEKIKTTGPIVFWIVLTSKVFSGKVSVNMPNVCVNYYSSFDIGEK